MVRWPKPPPDALFCLVVSVVPEYNQVVELELCPFRDVNCITCECLQWCAVISMDYTWVYLCFPYDVEIPNAFRSSPPCPPCLELLWQYTDDILNRRERKDYRRRMKYTGRNKRRWSKIGERLPSIKEKKVLRMMSHPNCHTHWNSYNLR